MDAETLVTKLDLMSESLKCTLRNKSKQPLEQFSTITSGLPVIKVEGLQKDIAFQHIQRIKYNNIPADTSLTGVYCTFVGTDSDSNPVFVTRSGVVFASKYTAAVPDTLEFIEPKFEYPDIAVNGTTVSEIVDSCWRFFTLADGINVISLNWKYDVSSPDKGVYTLTSSVTHKSGETWNGEKDLQLYNRTEDLEAAKRQFEIAVQYLEAGNNEVSETI